jgi:hemerythrin
MSAVLDWNESLSVGQPTMDDTHREFVDLLNRLAAAPDDQVLACVDAFITHSETHFGQEQAWMGAMKFAATECHVREHDGVMEVVREVRNRVAAGETALGKVLAAAVAEWFENHARSMDAVLAMVIRETGFNIES